MFSRMFSRFSEAASTAEAGSTTGSTPLVLRSGDRVLQILKSNAPDVEIPIGGDIIDMPEADLDPFFDV